MDWNQWSSDLKAKQDAEGDKRLQAAILEALADGKEPFDIDIMDKLWESNPDQLNVYFGCHNPREKRIAEWSDAYYLRCPQCRTMIEFVREMKDLQSHGAFD